MKYLATTFLLFLISCQTSNSKNEVKELTKHKQYITVLGITQDGGYPHIGCQKSCCANFYN